MSASAWAPEAAMPAAWAETATAVRARRARAGGGGLGQLADRPPLGHLRRPADEAGEQLLAHALEGLAERSRCR